MKQYLEKLSSQHPLNEKEMMLAAQSLFSDEISESEIAAFLIALKSKGETAEEIASLVKVLRQHAVKIKTSQENIMDNCGTGGDGSQSFNISTASAFVLAGAGIKIAKHGNRSVSSKTGSADVLEELGVNLELGTGQIEELLEEAGITFLFAPSIQPKTRRIMKIRRELKVSTVFNIIGPLTNPVNLDSQLLGVYRKDLLGLMASVLNKLGRKRAVVLTGAGNMDEASLQGENSLVLLENGRMTSFTVHPEEVGLPVYSNEAIRGGGSKENSEILLSVLRGVKGPCLDTVLLNSGIGIYANGRANSIAGGIQLARESIQSGQALEKLQLLIAYSQKNKAVI
ncbi:anthranilate phosphoribosyltransferase/anthranilate synthase/phosphoribosyltransferase [Bacillus sp. OV322]|uniref:anthranilate phosphoribosyltransferase n=1 Tax=Bacillus sp. OV322 TaxID=1882764 RepID=UPI0008F2DD1F|nr:anthranilate phosphoribosyltransferase [Bacillus sp. OV322]SFC04112.1 anthranilate phosphoribosyltransferase/anthranilate synthase/phosphoribosyltransferase [Bacillus sp. OV322]